MRLDSQSLILRNFTYDGAAPDAFLIGGVSARPSGRPDVVFPFPFPGQHYQFGDKRIAAWGAFDGSRDLVVTLPKEVQVSELRWLSIWCRQFGVNFGQAFL